MLAARIAYASRQRGTIRFARLKITVGATHISHAGAQQAQAFPAILTARQRPQNVIRPVTTTTRPETAEPEKNP